MPTAPTAPLGKKLAALAKSVGVAEIDWQTLERASDGKADAFFYRYTARGAALADGLQAALDETLTKLPIPKVMSYQRPDGTTVHFVRPAHSLIALYGADRAGFGARPASQQPHAGSPLPVAGHDRDPHAAEYAGLLESRGRVSPATPTGASASARRCSRKPAPTRSSCRTRCSTK
jgi:glycyl-tRNA synthetase beta chain